MSFADFHKPYWFPMLSNLMDYHEEIINARWYPMHSYDSDGEEEGVYGWYPAHCYPRREKAYLSRIREFHDRNSRACRSCHPPPPPPSNDGSEYYRYFLTLTWNRKACTEEEWRTAVQRFFQSKLFKHGVYAFELGETGSNPHCHLLVFCQSKLCHNAKKPGHPIEKYKGTPHLKKFEYKYGHIDFEIVAKDNGIENYISKESKKEYFSNTTDTVHPLQPAPSPSCPAPSVPIVSVLFDGPYDTESDESDQ